MSQANLDVIKQAVAAINERDVDRYRRTDLAVEAIAALVIGA